MNVGEAVSAHISHRYPIPEPASPISTDRGRIARMNALEKALGSARAAWSAVGVSRETWRRWRLTGPDPRTGKPRQKPKPENVERLQSAAFQVYKRQRDERLRRARIGSVTNIHITGVIRWNGYLNAGNDGQRTTKLKGPAHLRACITPYLNRDLDALGTAFEEAISRSEEHDNPELIKLEGNAVEVSWS